MPGVRLAVRQPAFRFYSHHAQKMRYLLLFILLFLLVRFISHAYMNRPSVRGPRNATGSGRASRPPHSSPNASSGNGASRRDYREIEDADYEEIIEEEQDKQRSSRKS
jgi:hypothetical protein